MVSPKCWPSITPSSYSIVLGVHENIKKAVSRTADCARFVVPVWRTLKSTFKSSVDGQLDPIWRHALAGRRLMVHLLHRRQHGKQCQQSLCDWYVQCTRMIIVAYTCLNHTNVTFHAMRNKCDVCTRRRLLRMYYNRRPQKKKQRTDWANSVQLKGRTNKQNSFKSTRTRCGN